MIDENSKQKTKKTQSNGLGWLPLVLVGLLLLGAAYVYLQPKINSPVPSGHEHTSNSNGQQQPLQNESSSAYDENDLASKVDPINFTANPALDEKIGSEVSSKTYSVTMDQSVTAEKVNLLNGVAKLRLKGALKSDNELIKGASFALRLYTNKKEDYSNDQSILNVPINLKPLKNDAFPFQFNANLRITPGLYYYVIVEKNNAEPLHVGKFEVLPEGK